MKYTEAEIVNTINKILKEEHGNEITIDSLFIESNLDSFGTSMLLLELDGIYGNFPVEWLKEVEIKELTIRDFVNRINSK